MNNLQELYRTLLAMENSEERIDEERWAEIERQIDELEREEVGVLIRALEG